MSNPIEPVPRQKDVNFMSKTRKNGVKVEKVRSIFFSNFFFEINGKFYADFKNTCFESTPSWKKNDKMMW